MANDASITITAHVEGNGLLLQLETNGDHSAESIDRRFYSIPELPPPDVEPEAFWGPLLMQVGSFLVDVGWPGPMQ